MVRVKEEEGGRRETVSEGRKGVIGRQNRNAAATHTVQKQEKRKWKQDSVF